MFMLCGPRTLAAPTGTPVRTPRCCITVVLFLSEWQIVSSILWRSFITCGFHHNYVPSLKARCYVHGCLSCTQRTSPRHMMSTYTRMRTTLSCMICSVITRTWQLLSTDSSHKSQTWVTGWQPTGWSSTPTRPSFSGPVPRAVLLRLGTRTATSARNRGHCS